ncbi:glutaminase [Lipomyces tetrasporus]|uniref:Glutaminase n=1 Tax=Lipomyces tetrasporus TaxID=54092 RepID=A0AAD7QZC7_9ASCO|nr:glutaminase [Lipomyces tetrasporus]KAJ8103716.1 glutaminase [Lipomyces tetrasporus]
MIPFFIVSLLLSLLPAIQGSTFSPARPLAQPLAVTSPYLSARQQAGGDGDNGGFARCGQILGSTGLINVDGTTYAWMGAPLYVLTVDQISYTYTSTSSAYVLSVNGAVEYFVDEVSALYFFHNDYDTASALSASLDSQVQSDATGMSDDYATLALLSLRQAFGGTQLVGTNSTYVFLKEISSDGNVNTVAVIFPAHPAFLYTNPTYVKLLLAPLFENQEAGLYPNKWSMHDLGSHYPNGTGHPDGNDEQMPLEECGNNGNHHYKLVDQWTQFLVAEALYSANQISTDDFAGSLANQTNLALKGVIGIKAMSVIANVTANSADAANYSSIANSYISQWQNLGFSTVANPPHATLSYGSNNTWGLLYNLLGDKMLNLGLVPDSVYEIETAFYATVNARYGDWESWIASVSTNTTFRDMVYSDLANWINTTPTNMAETDLYDIVTGNYPGITFINRPVMGGVFAQLVVGMGLSA